MCWQVVIVVFIVIRDYTQCDHEMLNVAGYHVIDQNKWITFANKHAMGKHMLSGRRMIAGLDLKISLKNIGSEHVGAFNWGPIYCEWKTIRVICEFGF